MGNNQVTQDRGVVTVSQAEIVSTPNPMLEILQKTNTVICNQDLPLIDKAKYNNLEFNQINDIVALVKRNYENSTQEIVERQVDTIQNKLFSEMKKVDTQFTGTLTPHLIAHLAVISPQIIKTQQTRSQVREKLSVLDEDIENISTKLLQISDNLKRIENTLPK